MQPYTFVLVPTGRTSVSSKLLETHIPHKHYELVEQCKAGNPGSQYRLYSQYVDAMYNVGLRLLGNKEDAEDIVQESFVQAFKNLEGFRHQSSFGHWLKRIVINRSINHLKARRVCLVPLDEQSILPGEEEVQENDPVPIEKVRKGMARLPNGYRQIINLYLVEGYDHLEIGEILDISPGTSKSQYHRAKKKLLEILKEM